MRGRSVGSSARLRRKNEIDRCQKNGTKLHAKHFLILIIDSPTSHSRLAIAVTTKLEKRAVVRNRIKRRIREVFRHIRDQLVRPCDLVVIARKDVQSCEFADYQREIVGALRAKGYLSAKGARQ